MLQTRQELMGDISVLSNNQKWAICAEIRKGKVGGMAFTLRSSFYSFLSDYYAMITPVRWKVHMLGTRLPAFEKHAEKCTIRLLDVSPSRERSTFHTEINSDQYI